MKRRASTDHENMQNVKLMKFSGKVKELSRWPMKFRERTEVVP